MKTTLLVAVLFACTAFAQGAAPAKAAPAPAPAKDDKAAPADGHAAAGAMDMSAHGPWTRKVKDEKAVKKEVDDFFKKNEELEKAGDMNGMLANVDFPVWMVTDDTKGEVEAKPFDKDAYTAMMKPMYENMPKDMKTTHKATVSVLSDALVAVTDDFTTTMGKQKLTGRNSSMLVKVGGAWKWKMMAEAGWGGMGPPAQAAAKPDAKAGEQPKAGAAAPANAAGTKK